MFLKFIALSTKLEIYTSKKFTGVLYFTVSVIIFAWWVMACSQFVIAYYTLHEFDVEAVPFSIITLFLFGPTVYLGAYFASIYIQRLRLRHWFKNIVTYPTYSINLKPAVAGVMADYEYNISEVQATLIDLHFKGAIKITLINDQINVINISSNYLDIYELAFVNNLFKGKNTITLNNFNDSKLINAGTKSHHILIAGMTNYNMLIKKTNKMTNITVAIKGIFIFGGILGLANLYVFIFHFDTASNVLYPRYPVHPAQLWSLVTVTVISIAILLTGFVPRFNPKAHTNPERIWLINKGYQEYLRVVYIHRFNEDNISTQDYKTIANVLPYAVAYKITPLSKNLILQIEKCRPK